MIFHTTCWEDALEKSTKSKSVSWHQSEHHVTDALDEKNVIS